MKYIKLFFFIFLLFILIAGWNIQKEKEAVPVPIESSEPEPTEEAETTPIPAKAPEPVLLGSAKTEILDWADTRLHNIKLSIQKINGYTLAPGAEFSFNRIVGERTAERGYQKATVLIKEEKVQDYGGGVCQVSSTLFQAARKANLSVTERHSHQKDVGYAHQGDDAAVDYGNKDMRFVNNREKSVKILMSVGNGVVTAEIYEIPYN